MMGLVTIGLVVALRALGGACVVAPAGLGSAGHRVIQGLLGGFRVVLNDGICPALR